MDWIKRFSLLDFEVKQDRADYISVEHQHAPLHTDTHAGPEYTRAQVAEHSDAADGWVIIGDYVYDVTNFIREHPGGEDIMYENLGRDITVTFTDVGHSKDAMNMLIPYLKGVVAVKDRLPLSGEALIFKCV